MKQNSFKVCTVCKQHWIELEDLIRDKNLYVNGYQASFCNSDEGLFYFTHMVEDCGTTLAIPAETLRALYTGPKHSTYMALSDECPGHCMAEDDLDPCSNNCDMRWAREVLQVLKNHGPDERMEKLIQLHERWAA